MPAGLAPLPLIVKKSVYLISTSDLIICVEVCQERLVIYVLNILLQILIL